MLQTLMEYGSGLDSEPGFKTREVRWCIELADDGRFLNILPLGDGKRGEMQPRCPDMHNMVAGGKSHFLVETAQTVALLFKANEEEKTIVRTKEKQQFFIEMLRKASVSCPELSIIMNALDDPEKQLEIRNALAQHKAKPSDWLSWRVGSSDPRTNEIVQLWWREWRKVDLEKSDVNSISKKAASDSMICFLTGELIQPLATQPKITGLSSVGGLGMGDVMVGFDKAAFSSYGLDQSANAAMGALPVQQYVDGLNDLVRNHSRKLANALVVHWFKERVALEDDPLEWLNGAESEDTTRASAHIAARNMLDAIRNGKRTDLGNNYYYAMTISGASGRVMVRDWMEGQFETLVANIERWFSDLTIVARDGNGLAHDPKFMAVCGSLVRELKDLPAPTTATLWKTAVQKLPIPQPLMAQALARFRADLIKDEPFIHARMGLIKAYFVRLQPGGDTTMTAYLNPDHPAPAYHCGRLLAIFANLQRAALGDVGAGVVQRYYASASQTPGLVIGRLASNARNHLSKLDGGLAWRYEEQIADVMSRLGDAAPRTLDLNGQGLFALGYYQQLAKLRFGNKTTETNQGEKQ
ncbi:MAG: type I-C CRISPR-associated protein Cas8c/Csd1 [Nitrosomonas sp.]|uniref:type I-C CRISPR-associated protein Cas8c/Csd1 n=1 Tax=Nitrosomonas sp. TaxID=42353 RepID=UPI001DB0FA09|nr:type I-C CRISPR-associated protein Cas8c/Csd1 [Nitrosomonas sp.]MBX9895408.1 type I-C CRISPR-associated protein Cas8c/Csd1 [Nitrosomonas sp.]